MRKGILSLSPLSRRTGKRKTNNMTVAEQESAKAAESTQEEQPTVTRDKPFVQTIQVPKTRAAMQKKAVLEGKARRKPAKKEH